MGGLGRGRGRGLRATEPALLLVFPLWLAVQRGLFFSFSFSVACCGIVLLACWLGGIVRGGPLWCAAFLLTGIIFNMKQIVLCSIEIPIVIRN